MFYPSLGTLLLLHHFNNLCCSETPLKPKRAEIMNFKPLRAPNELIY